MEDLTLDKMVKAFKDAHKIDSVDHALLIWECVYKGTFATANDEAWHFTAYRMAFLDT